MASNDDSFSGRLAGKVALITGGASGFGAAMCTRFSQEGCNVLLADLNEQGAQTHAQKLGSNVRAARMDVTLEADWQDIVASILDTWGKLDIVVNNAGTSYKNKPTADVTEAEFDRVFAVNVKSIFWSGKHALPAIQRGSKGGAIINIASIGSVRPRPGLVWYNATKGAVSNATKALAAEYGPQQIRVNAICPLLSGTALFESFTGVPNTPENVSKFLGNVPLGRLTEPEDVAAAALFLASDEGRFITGVNLEVDGGRQWG
jgi:NAD(P)-dependent dehydrogenase (short-subunit alcohol dehydrogenase family)